MKEIVVPEWDPVQLKPATHSSSKRGCLALFITIQFGIICILGLMLRNIQTRTEGNVIGDKERRGNWWGIADRMQRLNENPVYSRFNIPRQENRPKINLLIIVSSAPTRGDRRSAIRDTWWNQSYTNNEVRLEN